MSPREEAERLRGKLIVSCQGTDGELRHDPEWMASFAHAAVRGGAAGIRANDPKDVRAIRAVTSVPIIGIQKAVAADGRILITPSFESARELVEAGATMIAIDCTRRGRGYGALERARRIRQELGVPVLADIATLEEALAAAAHVDFVLSTLRGYTDDSAQVSQFEPRFIEELVRACPVPVIAEGRIHMPRQAAEAIDAGAFAVIVGTAITRPRDITLPFAAAVERAFARRRSGSAFIGIDLGGTNTKFGIVSTDGKLLFESSIPTPATAGREALLETLKQAAATARHEGERLGVPVAALGVATAGWVDARTGRIAYATGNLPGWTGTPVAETLEAATGLPVAVENDANALAAGEKHFGAGRRLSDLVCITLGTGVGGGCYVDGQLNRGAHFFANALGHLPLVPDGLPCTCGQNGCLEVYANAAALVRYAGASGVTAAEVIAAANAGDPIANNAIRTLGGYLARGCAAIVQILDPQALILAGGLAMQNPELIRVLRLELPRLLSVWEQRQLEILPSELGYFGGVYGAAALARDKAAGEPEREAPTRTCNSGYNG